MPQYIKSDLCTGYDLGATCFSCCYEYLLCRKDMVGILDAPLTFRLKQPVALDEDKTKFVQLASIHDTSISLPRDFLTHGLETFPEKFSTSIGSIGSNFEESLTKFYELIDRNTTNFENRLESETIEQISRGYNFLGKSDGKIGCLLYKFDKPEENKFYRPRHCPERICTLASNSTDDFEQIMREFITDNLKNQKFNTLSYTRLIHLITDHKIAAGFILGFDGSQKGLEFKAETKKKIIEDLNLLLDIVTR
jgi:hypothetical protein